MDAARSGLRALQRQRQAPHCWSDLHAPLSPRHLDIVLHLRSKRTDEPRSHQHRSCGGPALFDMVDINFRYPELIMAFLVFDSALLRFPIPPDAQLVQACLTAYSY